MMRASFRAASAFAAFGLSACGSSATLPSIIAAAPPPPRMPAPPQVRVVTSPAPALTPAPTLAPPVATATPATTSDAPSAAATTLGPPGPPPAAGVVGVSVGQSLDDKDRTIAIAAQQDAVASGQRKSWRGEHGSYGFVTPGAETGACRDYTHRIFINGRPQEAKGQACKQDGQWRVTS